MVERAFEADLVICDAGRDQPPEGRDVIDKSRSNKWFLFPTPNPTAALRLFCFHYAGGSAQVFHDWPGRLPVPSENFVTLYFHRFTTVESNPCLTSNRAG